MGLNAVLHAGINVELTGVSGKAETSVKVPAASPAVIANGTGAQQADVVYSATRTLAASANESLDLAGALENPVGGAAVFAKVKSLFIKAAPENTNNVIVGNVTNGVVLGFGAASQSWSIPPGGAIMVSAPAGGWTITADTADLLKVANSGGSTSVTYDIVIVGTSA